MSETSCIFAAQIAKKIWNDYLATPTNEGRQMQFSYQNLKDDITNILNPDTNGSERNRRIIGTTDNRTK